MYINPFVAGIITTVMVELILIIGYAVFIANKNNKKDK